MESCEEVLFEELITMSFAERKKDMSICIWVTSLSIEQGKNK